MSNRLTFSLASLILIFVAGFALLIPSTAEAADPVFDGTISNITLTVGDSYSVFLPAATDPDGDAITSYTVTQKTASGDDADPTLSDIGFTFTAGTGNAIRSFTTGGATLTNNLTGATGTYVYTATDASSTPEDATIEFTITVNSSVTINGMVADQKLKAGKAFELRLPNATDSKTGTTIAYTLNPDIASGVPGLAFQDNTRFIIGTPTADSAVAEAEYTYTATANDGSTNVAAAEIKFKIQVVLPGSPTFPQTAVTPITGTVGEAIIPVVLPKAPDEDGDEVTYTFRDSDGNLQDLPAGLITNPVGPFTSTSLASVSGVTIYGTPTVAMAETEYVWTATSTSDDDDTAGVDTATKSFNITIAAAPVTATAPAKPAKPTAAINSANDLIIDVSWTAPDDGGSAITGYTVKKYSGTTLVKTFPEAGDPAITGTSYSVGPVPEADRGMSFTFTVTATNAQGDSDPSDESDAVMVPTAVVVPDITQPASVSAVPQNDGSVMVTWVWDGTETAALAGFTVMWNGQNALVAAAMRSHTIPASMLTAGQSTMVSVVARATTGSGYATPATGTSAPSAVMPVNPDALRFAPGTTIPDQTFTVGEAIGTTAMPYLQLPVAHGGSADKTYTLHKGIGKVDVTAGDNGLSVDLENLRLEGTPQAADTDGTLYTWRAANVQQAGDVEVVVELQFMITVNAATIVTPTNVAPVVMITTTAPTAAQMGTFNIAYTATDANVGDTLTETMTSAISPSTAAGYTVAHDDAANMVTITQAATADHAVITVTIVSSDGRLSSIPKSIEVPFGAVTPDPDPDPPVRPGAPILSATAGDQAVVLTWTTPMGDIDSYEYSLNEGLVWIAVPNSTAATTTYTVTTHADGTTRLTNGQSYSFVVRAINATQQGPSSNRVVSTPKPGPVTPPPTPVVTITGPASLSCNPATPNRIMFAVANGNVSDLATGEITVGAGWKLGADNDPSDGAVDVIPNGDGSEIGVTSVAVGVNANAVRNSAAKSTTFTVGPVLTIPAHSYIVVIRTGAQSHLHQRDALYVGSVGVSGHDVNIQEWDCMPDLTVFFARSGAGIGGGAISVKQSHAHTGDAIGKGTVGVSEIMWGSDAGYVHGLTSNVDQSREQWIELHNTNNRTVTVTLFARPATTIIGGERAPVRADNAEIDRMSNFNVGGAWNVKGQSGNSALGVDFVSMYRSKNGNPYSHGDNNGRSAGKWHVSSLIYKTDRSLLAGQGATNPVYNFKGTPGRSNTISAVGPVVRSNVPNSPVIFNEVANRRDQTLEWIEIKNVSNAARDLRNWEIGLVTAVGTEHRFFHFNYGDNHVIIQPGEVILLVDTDPRYNDDHPVAVGYNIRGGNDQALGLGPDAPRYLVTNFREGGLPDDGNFVLTLRTSKGDEGYENKKGTQDRVSDAIGYHSNLVNQGPPNYTNLWPFRVFGHPNKSRNKMEVETVHYRRHAGHDPDQGDNNKPEQIALNNAGYTGVGYKRWASRHNPAHRGTPGYDHSGLIQNEVPQVGGGGVITISEIMLDQGDGRYPQWLELYNSSDSPVNLHAGDHGWRLVIENYDDGEIPINRLSGTLNFRSSDVQTILPKQTVLVASTRARSSGSAFFDTSVIFPPTRVFSVWDDARGALDMKRTTDPILSTEGFYIELIDGKGRVSDSIGNLIDSPNRRVAAEIAWPLSDITGEMMEDAPRSSILRRYREPKGGDSRNWVPYTSAELMDMGIVAEGWLLASKTDFREVRQTWYGHGTDIGSPGITGGRVLPVELSTFRPERLDDGSVAIRWITESEKDNAGFNILRSEDRAGEFTKINTQLIAGQGTTSERTPYEFVDKTAKPNVVYYYQIQDVSLDGDIQTLAVTHLRGHVSAAGKAATTWGELKALQ